MTVLIKHLALHLLAVKSVGLADVVDTHRLILLARQVAYRAHAQGIGEHVKRAGKTGQAQAVLDVIATAPMLGAGFIVGDELRVACGKVDGVDMRLEFGPAGKPQIAGNQPLGIGQTWGEGRGLQLRQLFRRRTRAQALEQFLGALALLFKVDAAIFGWRRQSSGHTNSLCEPCPLSGRES
ncbi:hypothetical protein D3C78_378190 [compost metagenome]